MVKVLLAHIRKIGFIHHSRSASIVFLEILIGITLCVGALILFALITHGVLQAQTAFWDEALSQAVYAMRNPSLNQTMIIISFLGADFALLLFGIVTIFLAWGKHKHEAILFVTILAVGLLLNTILKIIFQRPRPDFDPLIDLSSSYSFPSGHAMNAFIFYSVLAYFVYHFTQNKLLSLIAAIVALVLILLIGFSRVYLGVHYPSDVLAGFIAGFFIFGIAIILQRSIAFRNIVQGVKKRNKS